MGLGKIPTVIQHRLYNLVVPFEPTSWDLQSRRLGIHYNDFINLWALAPSLSMMFQLTLYLTIWLADLQCYLMALQSPMR